MQEQIVTFETAKLAKEKGFDELCREYYNENKELNSFIYYAGDGSGYDKNSTITDNDYYNLKAIYSAPTQDLLQKWLREVHKINIEIFLTDNTPYDKFHFRIMEIGRSFYLSYEDFSGTYEEAREEALLQALNYVCVDI